jgi:hypothetical protein
MEATTAYDARVAIPLDAERHGEKEIVWLQNG